MQQDSLLFSIRFQGLEPVYTNEMYEPITIGKRKRPSLMASSSLRQFKAEIKRRIEPYLDEETKSKLRDLIANKRNGLLIDINVSIPANQFGNIKTKSIKRKDVSNMVKALEDGIFEALGIDDKYTQELRIRKFFNLDDTWQIEVDGYLTKLWQERGISNDGEQFLFRIPGSGDQQ